MSTVVSVSSHSTKTSTYSKAMLWTGYVISALPGLLLLSSGINAMTKSPMVVEGTAHLGYSVNIVPTIGILAIISTILYAIPRTAVLGAILLTGYLGGAVASHLRIGETPVPAVVIGILFWGGLYLRDERVRNLIPFRSRAHALPNANA